MEASIRITGDELFPAYGREVAPHEWDEGFTVGAIDLDSVQVSGPGEAATNGDEIAGARWRCRHCGNPLGEEGEPLDGGNVCLANRDNSDDHEPEPIPVSWLNSAGVSIDTEDDSVMVRISVGDPRGAFVMRIERMRYTDGETGESRDELRLSVPTDQDLMPHMQLEPLASPGYYKVKDF